MVTKPFKHLSSTSHYKYKFMYILITLDELVTSVVFDDVGIEILIVYHRLYL